MQKKKEKRSYKGFVRCPQCPADPEEKIIFLKNGPYPAFFCSFSLFSHDKYSTNTVNEKAQMACLGLELGAAGW